ncbi:hypothetical protein [Morganella psychrotolerans]|uniref:Uncharacterized protein n=1 Tax=Morganella psychrotolerans TaxID=368603 RepID=A0A1B8HSN3_9GAMM|nr:hypothetical protein [Morganella psychrotolerans]OBU12722.1 hypothetical protein AYY18_14710 [Morganella psychrotolerans]
MNVENDVLNEIRELVNQNFRQYYGISEARAMDNTVCFSITNDLFSVVLFVDASYSIDMVFSLSDNNSVISIHPGIPLNNRVTIYKDKKSATFFFTVAFGGIKNSVKRDC